MEFERTTDYELLTSLMRDPALYPFIADDFAPPMEEAAPVVHLELRYILARDRQGLLGFYLFTPRSPILWEFHTVMRLDGKALAAMRELLGPQGWLWRNTECRRAVTYVPAYNRVAHRFGLRAGLQEYGRNPDSYLKHGELVDQILLGISRPKEEALSCHSQGR